MATLRAAVFPLSAKNRRGGHFLPPPPPVRVLKAVTSLNPSHQVPVYPLDYRSSFLCPTLVNPGLVAVGHRYVAVLEPPPGRGGRQWLGSLPRHSAGVGIPHSHCQVTRSTAILAHSIPSPSSHGSAMARTGRKSLIHTQPTNQILLSFGHVFCPFTPTYFYWIVRNTYFEM